MLTKTDQSSAQTVGHLDSSTHKPIAKLLSASRRETVIRSFSIIIIYFIIFSLTAAIILGSIDRFESGHGSVIIQFYLLFLGEWHFLA